MSSPRGRRSAMLPAMYRRALAILCLLSIGLGLAGCTKCGWLWDENTHSCHADAPLTH
ncbi:MAG TPA: hypothetical protein VHW95_00145 [Steroidobacteraceae bacterium]|nr:hypothetical protein [Steroidobacteraceae bacterium]